MGRHVTPGAQVIATIRVRLDRLDEEIPERPAVNLLKIDALGHELDVGEGAPDAHAPCRCTIVDTSLAEIIAGRPTRPAAPRVAPISGGMRLSRPKQHRFQPGRSKHAVQEHITLAANLARTVVVRYDIDPTQGFRLHAWHKTAPLRDQVSRQIISDVGAGVSATQWNLASPC